MPDKLQVLDERLTSASVTVKKDLSFLIHHLILTGVLVTALFLGVWGIQNLIEKHDEKNAQRSATELAVVVDQVKRLETTQAQHDTEVAQREAARDTLINTLLATISARDKALDDQLKKNATLTAQQAAARLADQYKAAPGEIVASGDTVMADLPISRQFVNTFDQFTGCKADYLDTQKQLVAEQGRTADLKTQVADRDATITGKNTELEKQKKADDEALRVAVDKEKKKHKWYLVGGVVIAEIAKFYLTGKP